MDYKEKLMLAKEALNSGSYDKKTIEHIFPELRESEDEKVRKAIFKALSKKDARDVLLANGIQVSDALTWLEKQGEQPSWSEEDDIRLNHLIGFIQKYGLEYYASIDKVIDFIHWLKSIKPQNHWKPSEQNIKDLEWCADLVKDKMGVGFHRLQVFIDELKSL